MSTTSQVANWRPHPGKVDTFVGQVSKAKAIHERLGATVNVAQTVVGGEAMTIVYMMTFDSGAAYGAFMDALGADSEWQTFWADAVASGSAEMVSTGLYTSIEGLQPSRARRPERNASSTSSPALRPLARLTREFCDELEAAPNRRP